MESNFLVCLNAVAPMFMLLCMGYIVRVLGLVTEELTKTLNTLIFKITYLFLVFTNIYGCEIEEVFNAKLIAFVLLAVIFEYILGTGITLLVEKKPKSRGAMIQAIYRSNFVILGLPIATNIYGHGNIGVTALMIAIVIPIYNVLAVSTLEFYRNGKAEYINVAVNIAKNPMIIGAIAGVLFSIFGIKLPGAVQSVVSDIGGIATPASIMVLGASFTFSKLEGIKKNLSLICILRLVIMPGIILFAAAFLGFRDISFVTMVALFAAPCAISSYTMAEAMDSDGKLAGAAVVFTSALCSITLFLWLLLFKTMGIF